jgi:hypothetical protein
MKVSNCSTLGLIASVEKFTLQLERAWHGNKVSIIDNSSVNPQKPETEQTFVGPRREHGKALSGCLKISTSDPIEWTMLDINKTFHTTTLMGTETVTSALLSDTLASTKFGSSTIGTRIQSISMMAAAQPSECSHSQRTEIAMIAVSWLSWLKSNTWHRANTREIKSSRG